MNCSICFAFSSHSSSVFPSSLFLSLHPSSSDPEKHSVHPVHNWHFPCYWLRCTFHQLTSWQAIPFQPDSFIWYIFCIWTRTFHFYMLQIWWKLHIDNAKEEQQKKKTEMRDERFCLLMQTANTMKTRIYSHWIGKSNLIRPFLSYCSFIQNKLSSTADCVHQ